MATPKNELIVSGHLDNLAQIGEFVTEAGVEAGLNERDLYAVQLSVDEACTNIIQHAYSGEGQGEIRLTYQVRADGLEIIIYDQGDVFNPQQVPDLDTAAPLEVRELGGMGLFFIKKLMDRVEFIFNTPEGNQLLLFKQRKA